MEISISPVGVREMKSQFSSPTEGVNESGNPLTVLKNNRPWVVIYPADGESKARRRRRALFESLTQSIEAMPDEPAWDSELSDRELLNEERVRRFG